MGLSHGEILKDVISTRPSYTSSRSDKKIDWSIGNIEDIDENSFSFKIGKTTDVSFEIKNENGDFVNEDKEGSFTTQVVLDWNREVCAFRQSQIMTNGSFPGHLQKLLNENDKAKELGATFQIKALYDSVEFIEWIVASNFLTKFETTFSLPNFFDVEEDFHKPLENIASLGGGKENRLTLCNEEGLKKDIACAVVSSLLSAGESVMAWCKANKNSKWQKRKSWEGAPVTAEIDTLESPEQLKTAIEAVRSAYVNNRNE